MYVIKKYGKWRSIVYLELRSGQGIWRQTAARATKFSAFESADRAADKFGGAISRYGNTGTRTTNSTGGNTDRGWSYRSRRQAATRAGTRDEAGWQYQGSAGVDTALHPAE